MSSSSPFGPTFRKIREARGLSLKEVAADIVSPQFLSQFERSQKGLRYQLIESKIVNENNLNISNEELNAFAEDAVKNYFRNYGIAEPTDEQVKGFTANILKNRNEVDRLYRELLGKKLLDFYKQTAKVNKKTVTFKEFEEIEFSK